MIRPSNDACNAVMKYITLHNDNNACNGAHNDAIMTTGSLLPTTAGIKLKFTKCK